VRNAVAEPEPDADSIADEVTFANRHTNAHDVAEPDLFGDSDRVSVAISGLDAVSVPLAVVIPHADTH
jgi:hypothetical protein